jgi:glycosyltransferase involved in cell wall biosynthesis
LLYPYYWPLYKAGGPVQSIYNLAATFKNQVDFYFISLDKDLDGQPSEHPLELNKWNQGPNFENIYCASSLSPFLIFRLVRQVKPDVLMVNGIFHWHTSFFGLLIGKVMRLNMVISPRGMLQAWALKRGTIKKIVYLRVLKLLLRKNQQWHATDEQEKKDILTVFGLYQQVHIASNVPRSLCQPTSLSFPDRAGKINLIFLSLINPNKNLHLIIDAVNKWQGKFTLDIYGPVIDTSYWQLCQSKINNASWISYKGAIPPWEVSKIIQHYHFFVLPTLGENFGHAIFDALASGVPVIISRSTPWQKIDSSRAGIYLDSVEVTSMDVALAKISDMPPVLYTDFRTSSYQYAKNYLDSKDYHKEYQFLFLNPNTGQY